MVSQSLSDLEFGCVQRACDRLLGLARAVGTAIHVSRDFRRYAAIRRASGDAHLNQAFDPSYVAFDERDFWLLAEDRNGAPVATYCSRCFELDDFYSIIASQCLWFGAKPRLVDPDYQVVRAIPAFGGVVAHAGGLWVRADHRGQLGLARLLPRIARALALRNNVIDHDSGMLLDRPDRAERAHQRAAAAVRTYGFARAGIIVDGWFPPERCCAIVHLCHSTRAEAIGSLSEPLNLPIAA